MATTTSVYVDPSKGSVILAEQGFKDLMIDSGGATAHQMFAIRGDGELMSWGASVGNNNLGLGSAAYQREFPTRVAMPFGKKVKAVTGNYYGTTALTTDNELYCWGEYGAGIGYGSTTGLSVPRRIIVEGTVVKIYRSSLSRSTGSTYLLNDQGDIFRSGEHPIFGTITTFTKLPRPTNSTWKDFNASGHSIWAWAVDGKAYSMGVNAHGQLGDGTTTNRTSWVPVLKTDNTQLDNIKNIKWTARYDGIAAVFFLSTINDDLWVCGYGGRGVLGLGNTANQTNATYLTNNVRDVNPNTGDELANMSLVKNDGTLWACGYNQQGQVGNGTTTLLSTLTQIRENGTSGNFITGVKSVFGCAAGDYGAVFFIKEDGSVWATGTNNYGSLGLGDLTDRTVYTQVLLGEPIETIRQWHWYGWPAAAYYTGTYFLARSGRLYSCGYNVYGSAGVGHSQSFYVPSQVILGK